MESKHDCAQAYIAALNRVGIRRYQDLGQYTVESLSDRLGSAKLQPILSQHNRTVAEFLFDQKAHGQLGIIEVNDLLKAESAWRRGFPRLALKSPASLMVQGTIATEGWRQYDTDHAVASHQA